MKQDEIKKIFKECKLDIYDSNGAKTEAIPFSRLEKFVTLYNQYLLSKKPSVSDEEIKNKAEETYKHSIIEERAFQNGAKWALSLTPPDAEAVMFAEWIYKNYISNGIGKYYHNNWNGDLDTLVNYTTQELFTLYKQGGK